MDFVFAADARRSQPLRFGMGPLVAAGGLFVPGEEAGRLEQDVGGLCRDYGFPDGEEFRLSPLEGGWMWNNLVGERRRRFLGEVLGLAGERKVVGAVVIHDAGCPVFGGATDAEMDVASSFVACMEKRLAGRKAVSVVIGAESGDEVSKDGFVGGYLETLLKKTSCMKASGVTVSVLPLPVRSSRLLQLARVVVWCTTAVVSGDSQWSGRVFASVRRLLGRERGRAGRVGLSLHPYYMYANLYHWLVGDTYFWMHGTEFALPLACYPYSCGGDSFGPRAWEGSGHREEKAWQEI